MHNAIGMGNLKIGTKLYIGFLLKILLTLAVGMVALYQIQMLGHLINEIYDHPLTDGYTMRDIRGDVNAMHDLMQRVPLVGDPAELDDLERRVNDIEAQVFSNFDIVQQRFLGNKEDVLSARKAFTDWKSLRAEEFRLAHTEGVQKLDKAYFLAHERYVDDLKRKIQTVVDFSSRNAQEFVETANQQKARATAAMIALIAVTFVLGLGTTFFITRSITPALQLIVRRMKDIAGGDLEHDVEIMQKDEIGQLAESFREMQSSLRNKAEVAAAIAAGDFSRTVEVRGSKDQLGNAINRMTQSLHSSKKVSDLQDWIKTGKNELNKIIVGEGDSAILAREITGFLAGYLNAQIGTLYLMTDENMLALRGTYAFSKRKSLAGTIELGEGLVGQAAVEKEIISITNIPDDYIRINSSFGDSPPRNIIASPFLFENAVKGVIELGSFEEFPDEKLDFLRDISSPVATAFHTVQNQARLRVLLDETQHQAAQLKVQEEELRAANEELEEQTKSLKQSEDRLRQQQEEMEVINEELEEKNQFLEKQKEQIAQKNQALEDTRQELEHRARELEVTSKYKSEFLANMSHELRTPLNSLLLLSRDLSENVKGNLIQDQIESARIIHNSGTELLHLIDEILDLSKIEAGKMTLNIADVNLRGLVHYVEQSFRRLASEKGVGFEVIMEESLPDTIRTDRRRLEQILKNLLSNALKFTERGSVTVEIHRPTAAVDLSRSDLSPIRTVAFTVRDTGIGIPEDKQMLVFEAFQQVDGGTTRKYGGTGLGLSITRELTRILGGEIQLASRPGEGSTFTLYLPAALSEEVVDRKRAETSDIQPDLAATPAPAPSERYERAVPLYCIPDDREDLQEGDKTILIVEDDASFAKILVDLCHAKGFKALASPDGEGGLALSEKYLPAAVILDIKLPGMSGWTVLNALKANPETRHIPVHIMTVEGTSIDALQKGAIGFLTKPVNREELEEAFKRIEGVVEKRIKDLLLVEDNAQQRHAIVNLIADTDVNIVEVGSGADALAALAARRFDCMILDLGLADITGFELLNRIEGEGDICMPPVIVYTGKDLTREEERELRKHAESIIIKGVRSEERLLDETSLFLHKTLCSMPARRREMIINLHDRDAMFEGKTILLVDDDMRNLFALSKILSEKGINVIKAEDGMKAMEVLEKNPSIDLVLLDIMMPVMDGFKTAKAIREQPQFKNLPIIALTAKAMREDRDKCIAAGANDYLSKPVEVDRLLSILRVWLYKR